MLLRSRKFFIASLSLIATLTMSSAAYAVTASSSSSFFGSIGFPMGDTILNQGLGLLMGPGAALAAFTGIYKTYQNLNDAQHTGEYANKATFGYATMGLTAGSVAAYHYISTNAAAAAGLVLSHLHHVAR